jgi:hypothetical protein
MNKEWGVHELQHTVEEMNERTNMKESKQEKRT